MNLLKKTKKKRSNRKEMVQDLKTEIEIIKKTQTKGILEYMEKQSGTTNTNTSIRADYKR